MLGAITFGLFITFHIVSYTQHSYDNYRLDQHVKAWQDKLYPKVPITKPEHVFDLHGTVQEPLVKDLSHPWYAYSCERSVLSAQDLGHVTQSVIRAVKHDEGDDPAPHDKDYDKILWQGHMQDDYSEPKLLLPDAAKAFPVKLEPGQPFCVRIKVPAPRPRNDEEGIALGPGLINTAEERRGYVPYDGTYWDSLLLTLVGRKTGISMTLSPKLWQGHWKIYEQAFPLKADLWRSFFRKVDIGLQQENGQIAPHLVAPRDSVHIYETEVRVVDPDTFFLEGFVEYQDGRWNFEWAPLIPYKPANVSYPKGFVLEVADRLVEQKVIRDVHSSVAWSQQTYKNHVNLPFCGSRATSFEPPAGRWVPSQLFTNNDDNHVKLPAPDQHGNIWAPFDCRYREITYPQFEACLIEEYPFIHWFGDSNTRRSLKKIVTKGDWCRDSTRPPVKGNETWERWCHCEDFGEPNDYFNSWNRVNLIRLNPDKDPRTIKEEDQNRTELWFYKWDGLTKLNDPMWEELFKDYPAQDVIESHMGWAKKRSYDENSPTPPEYQHGKRRVSEAPFSPEDAPYSSADSLFSVEERSLEPRSQHDKRWYLTLRPPSIVIVSLSNWDTAFIPFREYSVELDKLVAYLEQRFIPYNVPIVYRTVQDFCCRIDDNTDWHRRFTTSRMEAYDRLAIQKIVHGLKEKYPPAPQRGRGKGGKNSKPRLERRKNGYIRPDPPVAAVGLWDVNELGRQRPLLWRKDGYDCPSNHVQSELVQMENQVLMEGLCGDLI